MGEDLRGFDHPLPIAARIFRPGFFGVATGLHLPPFNHIEAHAEDLAVVINISATKVQRHLVVQLKPAWVSHNLSAVSADW